MSFFGNCLKLFKLQDGNFLIDLFANIKTLLCSTDKDKVTSLI
jgi:hypothetical protein